MQALSSEREGADILLAFEESEFYRNLPFLKTGGATLINTSKKSLSTDIERLLKQRKIRHFLLDADAIAMKKVMIQSSNMAMLGFFSTLKISFFPLKILKRLSDRR